MNTLFVYDYMCVVTERMNLSRYERAHEKTPLMEKCIFSELAQYLILDSW